MENEQVETMKAPQPPRPAETNKNLSTSSKYEGLCGAGPHSCYS